MLGDTDEKIVLDWLEKAVQRQYVGLGVSEEEETEFVEKIL